MFEYVALFPGSNVNCQTDIFRDSPQFLQTFIGIVP
jgi:hypothetical protein